MPWHLRTLTAGDQRRFRDLSDRHSLTLRMRHELGQTAAAPADPGLRALESADARTGNPTALEGLLDDTQAADVVGRLAESVRREQSRLAPELKDLKDQVRARCLEGALQEGKTVARLRWEGLPDSARQDLRLLLRCFADSPFGEIRVERALRHSLEFELRACPHHDAASAPAHEVLCETYAMWLQGFARGLNPAIRVTTSRRDGHCFQRWALEGE